MKRSVALGFGAAGAVVAAAVITIAGATVGLVDADESRTLESASAPAGEFAPAGSTLADVVAASNAASSEVVTTALGEQVEYVYVEAPVTGDDDHNDDDHDDDDGHEDDNHDEREGRERGHEDDD